MQLTVHGLSGNQIAAPLSVLYSAVLPLMSRSPILSKFIRAIEDIAPLRYADKSWDNVGLLLECPTVKRSGDNIYRVLLTIDLTEQVYREAMEKECGIIFSYHPPWFRGEKSMTLDEERGIMRNVTLCASSGISIYSSHSALDAVRGGSMTHDFVIFSFSAFFSE